MKTCGVHKIPAADGRCAIRGCVRGIGRRYCPRHGVALDADRKCSFHEGCDFVDGPVTTMYHVAPVAQRAQIQATGLQPRRPARRGDGQPHGNVSAAAPVAGIPVFCDLRVALSERQRIEGVIGACDVWLINASVVSSTERDRRAAGELLLITHHVAPDDVDLTHWRA